MSDAGIDVTDRDWVHRIASEALGGRTVQSLRDLTIDDLRAVYRWVDKYVTSLAATNSSVAAAETHTQQEVQSESTWHAWLKQHRSNIALEAVANAIERRHVDVADLCAYIYGTPAPTTEEQTQLIIEDLAASWPKYVAAYSTHSQEVD